MNHLDDGEEFRREQYQGAPAVLLWLLAVAAFALALAGLFFIIALAINGGSL